MDKRVKKFHLCEVWKEPLIQPTFIPMTAGNWDCDLLDGKSERPDKVMPTNHDPKFRKKYQEKINKVVQQARNEGGAGTREDHGKEAGFGQAPDISKKPGKYPKKKAVPNKNAVPEKANKRGR